tara:strand:+ start:1029 stop:1709 length:681 start_codon:yes stop_codon:yes gene_type:complete
MSRIIFFGDSFAEPKPEDYVWTKQLARKFDAELVNHAVGGSSIEFSLFQFAQYMKQDYRETDKIIFIVTHPSRSPVVHPQYDPSTANLNTLKGDKEFNKAWLKLHLQLYKFTGQPETDFYKYFIVTSVLNSITNDTLMMCSFEECEERSTRDNFVVSRIHLREYSESNWKAPNHYWEPNHNAMSECAYKSIINKKDMFDTTLFTSGNKLGSLREWAWKERDKKLRR